jgi:hypothetical protein
MRTPRPRRVTGAMGEARPGPERRWDGGVEAD